MSRKTKIVCTIGPSTESYDVLKKMILAGMNVARINFSHGSWDTEKEKVDNVKRLREELQKSVAIMLDTKGPEIRLGKFIDRVYLKEGNTFVLKYDDVIGNENEASISYKGLFNDVKIGTNILLDDGIVKLVVKNIVDKDIVCKVEVGNYISSNKSVNVPDVKLDFPSLTDKDIKDITEGIQNGIDYISASFVRRKEDVLAIREILNKYNSSVKIISKIENKEGLDNFDEILEVSDGIMVARGDLGVELSLSEVPIWQKMMIKKAREAGKIVITATQMLESMTNNPNPTRAEVSDVANAIFDGTSAIMLSGETAVGKYPIECVKCMDEIALKVENSIDYWNLFRKREIPKNNFEFIINHALITTALDLDIKAIFCYTHTGDTPRIVSSMSPKCPIYVSISNRLVYNQLALVWGIDAVFYEQEKDPKEMIMDDINYRVQNNLLEKGDIVLIAGGKYMFDDGREINKSIGGIYQI